jgi:hypothetical protein
MCRPQPAMSKLQSEQKTMISLEDCIGLCGLDHDEVAAISEHEHISEIAAAALGRYLLQQPHGGETIREMIIEGIRRSLDEGRVRHAAQLFMALRHFLEHHPEGRAGLADI